MKCFGEYKADRICDLCDRTNHECFVNCLHTWQTEQNKKDLQEEKARVNNSASCLFPNMEIRDIVMDMAKNIDETCLSNDNFILRMENKNES